MPKRKKKAERKKISRRKGSTSRDTINDITSPSASLEQSINNGYEVVWNDKSPLTTAQPIIGHAIMRTLQGKVGLVQKREGHQLLELFKSNMQSGHQHQCVLHGNSEPHDMSRRRVVNSTQQQLAEITRAQGELKQLAKRLQYYDDDDDDGQVGHDLEHQQQCPPHDPATGHNTSHVVTSSAADSNAVEWSTVTVCTVRTSGVVTGGGDSGVVESDTDTMSCCDDDSSPDHYHPIGLHHRCGGVADNNKTVSHRGRCNKRAAPQCGGVAHCSKKRPIQSTKTDSNNFPLLSDTGIVITDDDAELDKIFASVEMSTSCCYDDAKEDDQFWSTAAMELAQQEVGLVHSSTPCSRPPATPTITNSNNTSSSEFLDMILTGSNDLDLILNQT